MRRDPSNPSHPSHLVAGGASNVTLTFDVAYAELAAARAAYDQLTGDPEHIASLAEAAARLERARRQMSELAA